MSATYQYQAGGTTVTGVNRPLSAVVGAPAGVIEGSLSRDAVGRVRTAHWQRRGTIRGTEVYGSVTYQYDAAGRRRQATDFANVSWHYGYNKRGEVTGAEKRAASGTVLGGWGQGYSYDDIGNRRQVVTPEGETLDLTANALNQISTRQTEQKAWLRGRAHPLASVEVDGNAVTREGRNWKFLLNAAGSGSELRMQEYLVQAARADLVPEVGDEINETVTFRPSSVSLTHDDAGNLTFDGRWHYEWDAENRLTSAASQCDGYGAYPAFAKRHGQPITLAACWAHARREFVEASQTGAHKADALLIGHLYAIEARLREQKASAKLRAVIRSAESQPVMDRIGAILRHWKKRRSHLPTSQMGKAVDYTLTLHTRAPRLRGYQKDTHVREHGERQAEAWLKAGLKTGGLKEGDLIGLKGSDPRKLLLADLLWRRTVVSQEWLAEKLAMKSGANVSQQLRRLDRRRAAKGVPEALVDFLEKAQIEG